MAKASMLDLWLWPLEAARTATGLAETMWNTQAVIGARMPVIAAAFANPLAADTRELTRMVTEKVDAFGRSGRTLSTGHASISNALGANARDFGRMAGGDLLGPADWWRLAERNLRLWSTFATLPGSALQPVRTRVAGNARRLR